MRDGSWIGFDLDGTTAVAYWINGGEFDELRIGEPIYPTIKRIKSYLEQGIEVRIFTARVAPGFFTRDIEAVKQKIREWTKEHIGTALEATCVKDYLMVALYDDRARQVTFNTGYVVGEDYI